ncbi:pyridoxal phosphate-dependent aminotransferase [Mesobacterium sp. TK19101]|uniref:Aminotransferase n=1 Tax=Mesobacterium hydrothermale TaxID=3111907 RepID=A0ABU6HJ04_9RHOB|nr:pyridoxal phosphate-dependent aminotransferase [Mesobacterium sp. TK19101]MEC3862306.1 pyridoxal phosphate-dependent aminotransferase [Mesobacterium sp. TK19101]
MPRISPRLTTLNEDGNDGWGVFYRARRMVAEGQPVIELTIGEHDIGTDAAILDAMHHAARAGHTGYAMVPGIAGLRQAVAERVQARTGVATRPENVLITPGGQAALFACHMGVCAPGDTALYVDPYYATYPGTIRSTGARAVALRTTAENSFVPEAAALDALARETGPVSLLVNSPNNPTGVVYPRAALDALCQVVADHDMWLISDEVYDTQVWDGTHISPRALPGIADRTLVIGSMSKSHAMTGSRVGWVVGPEPMIAALIDLATCTTYGVPGYIQDAALFALQQGPDMEQAVAAPFARRRALAREILAGQNTVGLVPSGGAMYLFLDIRATGLSGEAFANDLLDTCGIAVMPGESFGASSAGHVRVAMTVDDAVFATALRNLVAFAETRAHGG